MKTVWIVLTVIAVLMIPMAWLMFQGMSEIRQLVVRDVDLNQLSDGTYTGSYHKGRWTYDVEVTVHDHRLVAVKNKNPRMEALKEWNEQAEAAMLQKQSIKVDVVSGASVNTKAFEKAVELALAMPPQQAKNP